MEEKIGALLKEAEELREHEETETALDRVEQAVSLARESGQTPLMGKALYQKAILLGRAGRPKEALSLVEEAIDCFSRAGDAFGKVMAWKDKGVLCGFLQRPVEEVTACFNKARVLSDSLDATQKRRLEAALFQGEGMLNQAQGNTERAMDFFTSSRTLYHEIGEYKKEIDVWLIQAGLIKGVEEKLSDLEEIEKLAKRTNYVRGEVEALSQRGEELWGKRTPAEALRCYEKALTLSTEAGLKNSQVRMLEKLGESYLSLGRLAEAEDKLGKAYTLNKGRQSPFLSFGITWNLGMLHEKQDKFQQSILFYKEAAYHAEKMGWQLEGEIIKRTGAALEARYSGKFELAVEEYQKLREIYGQHTISLHRYSGQCDCLLNIAWCYLELGDYTSALAYAEEAKALATSINDSRMKLLAYERLATTLLCNQGYAEALDYFSKSIAISEELGDIYKKASSLEGRGRCYVYQGRLEVGLKDLEEALKLYITGGQLSGENIVSDFLADVYLQKGEQKKAQEMAQQAVKTARTLGPFAEAFSLEALGKVQLATKDYSGARASFKKSADHFCNIGLHHYAWLPYSEMGYIALTNNEYEIAYEDFKQCLGLAAKWRGPMKYLHQRRWIEGYSVHNAYRGIVQTLVKLGRYEEAFYYTGLAKGRYFIELLNNSNARFPLGDHPIAKELQELEKRCFSYLHALSDEYLDKRDIKRIEQLQEQLKATEEGYERLLEELKKQYPQAVSLKIESSCTVSDIQKVLSEKDLLLEYFITDKALIIWVITKKDIRPVIKEIEEKQLNKQVSELMGKIDSKKSLSADWSDSAGVLSSNLIAPVKELIEKKTNLFVVPHMALHWLPFEVLLEYSKLHHKTVISYLPTTALLPTLYSKEVKGRSFISLVNPSLPPNFDNLLGLSEHEKGVKRFSKLFPSNKVYAGQEANKENLEKEVGNYEILHIACHGEFHPLDPFLSFLLLSHTEETERFPPPWALTATECFSLNLKASLVTLCACVTGRGELSYADNFLGFSRAFIYAGASSVLVSLWYVDPESANTLMVYFYEGIAKKGLGKAQSLQRAKLKLQKEKKYEHPYFWAPFVLIGAP